MDTNDSDSRDSRPRHSQRHPHDKLHHDRPRHTRSRSRSRSPRDRHRRRHTSRSRSRDRSRDRTRHRDSRRRDRRNDDDDDDDDDDEENEDSDRRHRRHRHSRHHHSRHHHHRTRSPRSKSPSPPPARTIRAAGPLPSQTASFALTADDGAPGSEPPAKEKPNFAPTGLLAAASNTVAHADGSSTTLKYHEPPEARKVGARDTWTLFVFRGADEAAQAPSAQPPPREIPPLLLNPRSCWLFGRDAAVADYLAQHASVSKQHAVVQFRHVERRNEFGDRIARVRPYLLDLDSSHGTRLNGEKVPPSRYLELRNKDLIQFGNSSREYVLMRSREAE